MLEHVFCPEGASGKLRRHDAGRHQSVTLAAHHDEAGLGTSDIMNISRTSTTTKDTMSSNNLPGDGPSSPRRVRRARRGLRPRVEPVERRILLSSSPLGRSRGQVDAAWLAHRAILPLRVSPPGGTVATPATRPAARQSEE